MFKTGDTVAIRAPSRSSKLSPKFNGPYKIIGSKNDIYTLETVDGRETVQRNVNDLRAMTLCTSGHLQCKQTCVCRNYAHETYAQADNSVNTAHSFSSAYAVDASVLAQ